jgi:adenosylcobinamide-phosphate synthase
MLMLSVVVGLLLDKIFSEPKKHHPLIYFGSWADSLEHRFNQSRQTKLSGVIAVLIALLPVVAIAALLEQLVAFNELLHALVGGVILYVAIGWQSLLSHANNIIVPLQANDIVAARQALSMIVSRDTSLLEEKDIAKATTESVLENGADAIFSAIFWFCIGGIVGVVVYRLANTLDAMWGYKNKRFIQFGWAAARFDDMLNLVPARLTALSYALLGNFSLAIKCWQRQAFDWKSPNAGPVMAAGAGALNVSLGGWASYHGEAQQRPLLGPVETVMTCASTDTIISANQLLNRVVLLWLLIIILCGQLL